MIGIVAQCGPNLRSVNHVLVAIPHCARLHRPEVRAVVRLGKSLTPDLVSREDILDVLGLLLVGPHI